VRTVFDQRDPTLLPLPWVKWAYQPAHAEDVPAAFMRAYAVALQPPGVSTVLPNSMASATDTLSWK